MLFLHGGFHDDEAIFWLVAVDSNLVLVAYDLFVILVELVAEERELKTTPAGEGTVTLPPVTAPDTKQWNHVLPETRHLSICLAPKPLRRSG